jgi:hypothetical protein
MTTLRQSKEVQQLQSRLNEAIIEHGAPCDGYSDEFYADSEDRMSLNMAKFICAMAAQEEFGVWGGLTADERKWFYHEMKKMRRRVAYEK